MTVKTLTVKEMIVKTMAAGITVTIGVKPSDGEDEDTGAFYEDNSYDEVDYYDEDREVDEEAVGGDYDEYPYGRPSNWSCIMDVSPKSGP